MPEFAEARVAELLREKGTALFSGRIDLVIGALGGVVHMSDGQILEVRLGTTSGEPALWRMLLADRAKVAVESGKPRATSGAVLGKPDALLARFDERLATLGRYAEKVGGFDRVWAIRFDALAAVLDELPDAINPVLRLLDGRRTVRHVVAECGLDDMLAMRILGKLLAHGILVLPDMSSELPRVDGTPIDTDLDEGLEAALAASLAEIDAEDAAAAEPIPLVARVKPPPEKRAVPSAAALPSAPRVETNDDLRSWLGNEEAFFGAELRISPPTGDVVRAPPAPGIGVVTMVLLFVVAVGLGVLIASLV